MNLDWVNKFHKIIVFCPTFATDKTWSSLDGQVKSGKIQVIRKMEENNVRKLWRTYEKKKIRNPDLKEHVLFYFDDCGGDQGFKTNSPDGVLNQLCSKGNHANISMVYVVQNFIMASTIMRDNAEVFICFLTQTEHTQKHIYAQFGIGSFKDFKKVLMRATLGKYNYFVVNRQGPGVADYYHNFKKIDIKEFNIF